MSNFIATLEHLRCHFRVSLMQLWGIFGILALLGGILCLVIARVPANVSTRRFLTAKGVMWIICGIGCLVASMQDSASEAAVGVAAVLDSKVQRCLLHDPAICQGVG